MDVLFDKFFRKKLIKTKDKKLAQSVLSIINEVKSVDNIYEIRNIKKLSGHDFAYRIRIGKYRIGVLLKMK